MITESFPEDASDGIYRKQSLGLWGNDDGTKVIIYQSGGWDGCNAVNYEPDCTPQNKWGYMPDLIVPIDLNVNINRGTGSSSGKTTQCAGTVNLRTIFMNTNTFSRNFLGQN